MNESQFNRELTPDEQHLVRWMLEHGEPDALQFLPQLEHARVTPWRCGCGCASINFAVEGQSEPSGSMRLIADFLLGSNDDLGGVFIFEKSGILAGLEVYGLTGDALKTLPTPDMLRSFDNANKMA